MMKKAVILRCLKSSAGCTGSSCFNILMIRMKHWHVMVRKGHRFWHVLLAMDVEIL